VKPEPEPTVKLKDAKAIAGSLGYPSKMPGTSYGISATACITGQKLAAIEGSVCHGCYAMKANYRYSSVQKAHAKRLAGIGNAQWVAAMVAMLNAAHAKRSRKGRKLARFHRWHDSGDLQSRDHLARICAVARATPHLRHWLPTREGGIVREFVRDGGTIPDNLTIRLSATMVDGAAPRAWPITSTVHASAASAASEGHVCPAPTQGNKCGACRACWSRDVANVSYHVH
jgi:hypothetical protein